MTILATLVLGDDPDEIAAAIESVFGAPNSGPQIDELIEAAARNHCLLRVMGHLERHGIDLSAHRLHPSAVRSGRLTSILPALVGKGADLATLRDLLQRHLGLLQELVEELGRRHPGGFLVAYGLGLSLAYPWVEERESSDLDFFISPTGDSDRVLHTLEDLGFRLEGASVGRGAGRGLVGWKLTSRRDGHVLMVDGFTGGRPSGGHQWIPPFAPESLFARARPIVLEGGGLVDVPSPEDMFVMMAEKVQRKADYSVRRLRDARTVLASEAHLDWDEIAASCRRHRVELGLAWLLRQLDQASALGPGAPTASALSISSWEHRLGTLMTGSGGTSPRAQRYARALHRRLWSARYVLDHPHKIAALIEIGAGRLVKPTQGLEAG